MRITNEIIEKINIYLDEGLTNSEIAEKLNLSKTTVRKYTTLIGRETNSIKHKSIKEVNLTKEQFEIIYGCMLGDMSISKTEKLARIAISQGGKHEEYFDHLTNIFSNYLGKITKTPRYDKRTDKYYNKFSVRFLANELYLKLYKIFYPNGKKTITKEWLSKLTPRSIAYWFMDDGAKWGVFATNCFTKEEVILIKDWFKEQYDIDTRIYTIPNKEQYELIVEHSSLQKFENLIREYLISSMRYKLRYL